MEMVWSLVGVVIAICVAVLACTLVAWAIIAIGINVIKEAGRAKVSVSWLKRLYGREVE